jgi:hypothetical protein
MEKDRISDMGNRSWLHKRVRLTIHTMKEPIKITSEQMCDCPNLDNMPLRVLERIMERVLSNEYKMGVDDSTL